MADVHITTSIFIVDVQPNRFGDTGGYGPRWLDMAWRSKFEPYEVVPEFVSLVSFEV